MPRPRRPSSPPRAGASARGAAASGAAGASDFRFWAGLLLPAAVAVLVFARAAGHGFVWDDPLVLEQLRAIRGIGDLLVPPDAIPKFYYRPLIFSTFLVDRWLGGESPFWFHLTVILWHALATGLVFLLARQLLGAEAVVESATAALLFAVHPAHVESVAWIAGRSDVVSTTLLLGAVLVSSRTEKGWTSWGAGALFCAALLAKEVAVAGVVLLPARDLLVERRLHWQRYVPLLLALALYLALRTRGLGTVATGSSTGAPLPDLSLSLLAAVGWYAVKLVAPVHLSAYVPQVPLTAGYVIGGLVFIAAAGLLALRGLRERRAVVPFLCLWVAVTLAPSLMVIVRRSASAVLAERYLYLPSVALVILAAYGVSTLRRQSRRAADGTLAVLVGLAIVGALYSAERTQVWADDLVFWRDVATKAGDAMAHRELASALLRRNSLDEAEREFEAALALPASVEDRVMTYNNLGNLRLRRDDVEGAAQAYRTGYELFPHPYLLNGLGRAAMKAAEQAQARGDQAEVVRQVRAARDYLERAVAADANDYKNRVLLGQVLLSLGQRDEARRQLEEALAVEPRGRIADTARSFLRRIQAGH